MLILSPMSKFSGGVPEDAESKYHEEAFPLAGIRKAISQSSPKVNPVLPPLGLGSVNQLAEHQ